MPFLLYEADCQQEMSSGTLTMVSKIPVNFYPI